MVLPQQFQFCKNGNGMKQELSSFVNSSQKERSSRWSNESAGVAIGSKVTKNKRASSMPNKNGRIHTHNQLLTGSQYLKNPRHVVSEVSEECPFVVVPDCIVFDKVVPGVTYTKKVVLRNREGIGRRVRLELDPRSPFKISPLIYPGEATLLNSLTSRGQKSRNVSRVSGTVATGMCVQFFVSFSATSSIPEATGQLELHTEKGAFEIPVIARKKPLLLRSLPSELDFGAVRPGESAFHELTLNHEEGDGAIRMFIVCGEQAQKWISSSYTFATVATAPVETTAPVPSQWGQQQNHQKDAFGISAEEVLLRQGTKDASLTIRFTPKAAGLFSAFLLLIPAESGTSQRHHGASRKNFPSLLGVVGLRGIADAAALTLEEFCGDKWPIDLLTKVLPNRVAAETVERQELAVGTTTDARAATIAPGETLTRAIGSNEAALRRVVKETLLPQEIEFGFALLQGSRVVRTLTLCNEGFLPIHLVWRPTVAARSPPTERNSITVAVEAAPDGSASLLRAFSVSPSETVLPPKSSRQFCFVADPHMLPPRAVRSEGTFSSSSQSSVFCCGMILTMVNVPREALLSPWVLFSSNEILYPPSVAANEKEKLQKVKHEKNVGFLRWAPLFAETPEDGVLSTAAATKETRDWEVLRLQLRLKTGPPKVMTVGAPRNGDPATCLSPCSVQNVSLRVKNEGLSVVRVSLHPSIQALEVRWRVSEHINSVTSSSYGDYLREGERTAWLLRVESEELDELQKQIDPVFGLGPRPFGYFSISPQEGIPLFSGANGVLVMRLLPFCCGSFSTQVPLVVCPPDPQDIPVEDAAGQFSLLFPQFFEVSPPCVSACWPPQLDFGIVRAHSRTTRALLVYNNSNLPTVARIRILSPNTSSDITSVVAIPTSAGAAANPAECASGAFPCHFCSCLLRAPPEPPAAAADEAMARVPPGNTRCSREAPAAEAALGISTGEEPTPADVRSCAKCLCVDDSLRASEPFLLDPLRTAAAAAVAAATAAAAAHAESMERGKNGVEQQQHHQLMQHLAELPQQYQAQEQPQASAVIGLSGLLVVYPPYVVLPPSGQGVFLFTLRASHPQDINSLVLVESLEGSRPAVICLKGRVSLPRLRLSTQHLQLPPLFTLQPQLLQRQLMLHNDSDLPVKIMWAITTARKQRDPQQKKPVQEHLQQRQQEQRDATEVGAMPSVAKQSGLLLSLYPSECILGARSSVAIDISCLGLFANPQLEAKAFCWGEGLLMPLQISFAAVCSGMFVTYALFTQQQIEAAAALLERRREQRGHKKRWKHQTPQGPQQLMMRDKGKSQKAQNEKNHRATGTDADRSSTSPYCSPRSRSGKHQKDSSRERSDDSKSRDSSRDSTQSWEDNKSQETEETCAALQAAGIGLWGVLQHQEATMQPQKEHGELQLPQLEAGGEGAFVYLLVVNCCPIPFKVALKVFTHSTQQNHRQMQEKQSTPRHPALFEEGRPVGAFLCPDCNNNRARESISSSRSSTPSSATTHRDTSSSGYSSSRRKLFSFTTAGALLLQAATSRAPLELQQLQRRAFAEERLAFRTASGVHTLQAAARQRRKEQLLGATKEGFVFIPHPESCCTLLQQQATLLAVEMFAALPTDFAAAFRLCLEACLPQQSQPQQQQILQQQEVLIPVRIPVRGQVLRLPRLQPRICFRPSLPPLVTAQATMQNPLLIAQQHQPRQTQEHVQLASSCYRSNKKLLPLKKASQDSEILKAAATPIGVLQKQEQLPPQHAEQHVCLRIENSSSKWLRVDWLLFDLGMWEMQQQLQQLLQRAFTLKEAAVDALRRRAVTTAQHAAASAQAAAFAAAIASTTAATASAPSRKPARPFSGRAADPTTIAADAAATAAVAAEEAALKATEAAAAAAAAGVAEAAGGWEVIAAAAAETAKATEPCKTQQEQNDEQQQQQHSGAGVAPSAAKEESAASAAANAPTIAAPEAKATAAAGSVDEWPLAVEVGAPTGAVAKAKVAEPSEAPWADREVQLLPPPHCLIWADSPISIEARGLAAATKILRFYRAAMSAIDKVPEAAVALSAEENAEEASAATEGTTPQEDIAAQAAASAQNGTAAHLNGDISPCTGGASSSRNTRTSTSSHWDGRLVQRLAKELVAGWDSTAGASRATTARGKLPPPRLEPQEVILPPYGSLDMSLYFGRLQAAEGLHKLRAVFFATPINIDKTARPAATSAASTAQTNWSTTIGPRRHTAPQQSHQQLVRRPLKQQGVTAGTEGKTKPHLALPTRSTVEQQQLQNSTRSKRWTFAIQSLPLMPQRNPEDSLQEGPLWQCATGAAPAGGSTAAQAASQELRAPQPVAATPLVVDFVVETKRPCLQLGSIDESPKAAGTALVEAPAAVAAAAAVNEDHLGTLKFVVPVPAADNNWQEGGAADYRLIRKVLLQPTADCPLVSCTVSVEGDRFKLCRATLQQPQEQEKMLTINSKAQLVATLEQHQQLQLVVGFTPPANDKLKGGETKFSGKISVFFPAAAALGNRSAAAAALTRLFMLSPKKQHQHVPADETLIHALLSGILKLLHPDEDPRAMLALGLAALQQKQKRQEQLKEKEQEQLQQNQLLVKHIEELWPIAAKTVAAALAAEDGGQCGFCAAADAVAPAAKAAVEFEEGYMQTISLVGVCRQSQLLLLTPSEEPSVEQQQQATREWASYSTRTDPLVIDFNMTHVSSRKHPCKLLKLRVVSASTIAWRISSCNSSGGTASTSSSGKEAYDAADGITERAAQKDKTATGDAGAFEFSCVEGILGNHRGRDRNSTEATISIRFMPSRGGRYSSLFSISGERSCPQYFELRGSATTDEAHDVCASLGSLAQLAPKSTEEQS